MLNVAAAAGKAGVITSDMLSGLTDIIGDNLAVIVPAGVGIMAILLGITIVPKVIKKFF